MRINNQLYQSQKSILTVQMIVETKRKLKSVSRILKEIWF